MTRPTKSYADRVKCNSCINGSGPHGCTDCLNTGWDQSAFAGGIEQALNDAYAEGRKDEREAMLIQQCGELPFSGVTACNCAARLAGRVDGDVHFEGCPNFVPPNAALRRALGDIISQTVVAERTGYTDPQDWLEKSQRVRQVARDALGVPEGGGLKCKGCGGTIAQHTKMLHCRCGQTRYCAEWPNCDPPCLIGRRGPAPSSMRAEFEAWARDRGCDTDGSWSAWQGCWNLLTTPGVSASGAKTQAPHKPGENE